MHMYMLSMHMLSVYICIGLGSGGGLGGLSPINILSGGLECPLAPLKILCILINLD